RRLAYLYLTQGRVEKAREQVKADPDQLLGAYLAMVSGRADRAIRICESSLRDPKIASEPSVARPYAALLGLSFLAANDIRNAQKVADHLNAQRGDLFDKLTTRLYLTLSGAIAVKRGDGRKAVTDLEQSVSRLPFQIYAGDEHAVVLGLLAQAYTVAGDHEKARQTYEKITALTTGRLVWGDIYARSFYHLGLIAERQGDTARAREQFGKFLEIWKDADPGLPEVADAKKRLARLQSGAGS
ncbi:MAG: tetratricopeptide repeat protein, partial [Acidobacteria bacterium]|nr:tetratricopeptide repeat protein [Acidobacteriota bacterium]